VKPAQTGEEKLNPLHYPVSQVNCQPLQCLDPEPSVFENCSRNSGTNCIGFALSSRHQFRSIKIPRTTIDISILPRDPTILLYNSVVKHLQ